MYWQQEYECMDREELEILQLERLQATLNRVRKNVPFYRSRFESLGLEPEDIRTLDDFKQLPFTTKDDLRANYPYGLFAVPLREVVRLQASSGTTGKPTVVGYSRNDIRRWSNLVARILVAGGVTREDLVQIAFGYGLFTGGFGFHYGAEAIGASVIPVSSGGTRRQIFIMQDYRTTALVCTPSYALYLADTMEEMGININSLCLRWGLFGGEAWSEAMRQEIQDRLKIVATDNYGISEVMGPGIAGECQEQKGLHINEDHFLAEIINPATGQPVEPGQTGELVLTTLTKEAFPVIRFRTGDLTRLITDPCPCGRTFYRLNRILGRTDDMIIIRGVNVFPGQIESILLEIEGARPHYQIVLDREEHLDRATLLVEANEALLSDRMRETQELVGRIRKRLASELGVTFEVKLVEPKSLKSCGDKQKLVIDKRNF